eukprot:9470199-Pyramimonas_sp.AAC.2
MFAIVRRQVELFLTPPTGAAPSMEELTRLREATNAALAMFVEKHEANVSARGRARKLREAAEHAARAAEEEESKVQSSAKHYKTLMT